VGVFGDDAPEPLRAFRTAGHLTPAELVDRYELHCRPVRNLIVPTCVNASRRWTTPV